MGLYRKTLEEFENWYLGFIALIVISQSCLSSIAAMYILKNGNDLIQMIQLTLVVLISMSVNGSVLAQVKPKIVLNLFMISIVISMLLIIQNNL
jgi:hypothetical protein